PRAPVHPPRGLDPARNPRLDHEPRRRRPRPGRTHRPDGGRTLGRSMSPAFSLMIALALAGWLSAAGGASAQQPRTGAELRAAAERSFSDVPFGAPESPPGLTRVVEGDCQLWGECIYRDADHVGHYFWEGELVVKSIEV